MSRKKFANAFNSFINEMFPKGQLVSTAEIKNALNNNPKHPVHAEYKRFLRARKSTRACIWELSDFDRVSNWMKWHPGFFRVSNGIRKQWRHEIKVYSNFIKVL